MTARLCNRVASSPGADLKTQRAKEIAAQVGDRKLAKNSFFPETWRPEFQKFVLTGDDYVGVDLCVSAQPLTEDYSPSIMPKVPREPERKQFASTKTNGTRFCIPKFLDRKRGPFA